MSDRMFTCQLTKAYVYILKFAKFYFEQYSIVTRVYSNQIVLSETLSNFLSSPFFPFSFYEVLLSYKKQCKIRYLEKVTTKNNKVSET